MMYLNEHTKNGYTHETFSQTGTGRKIYRVSKIFNLGGDDFELIGVGTTAHDAIRGIRTQLEAWKEFRQRLNA